MLQSDIFFKGTFHTMDTCIHFTDLIGDSEAVVGHGVVRLEPDVHPAPG